MWMSHAAVPSDVIAQFAKEAGCADDFDALQIVEALSEAIEDELLGADAAEYRAQNLSPAIIRGAMRKAKIKCNVSVMETLVAYRIVGGKAGMVKNCDCLLESNEIEPEIVEQVVFKL